MKKQSPVRFFFKHAGWSYDPKTETRVQGRWKCARALAEAEAWARDCGVWYEWKQSDINSSDFSDEKPNWALFDCTAYRTNGKIEVIGHLAACDFGRDCDPWTDADTRAYARVVEANLALEAMPPEQE